MNDNIPPTGERPHPSQHDKAHRRYLEHRRAALVRELRRVNEELRQRTPAPKAREDNDWDFDPRSVSVEAAR